MATLLAAVPEAEPPKLIRDDEIPDVRGSKLGLRVLVALGIAVVVALAIAWITIGRQ